MESRRRILFSQPHVALEALDLLDQLGTPITSDIIHDLLKECTRKKDLAAGRQLCYLMMKNGFISNTFLGDHLIRMFAACGRLSEANYAFDNVPKPSIYTWNAIISAHANLGGSARAVDLYYKMKQKGIQPDSVTFLCSLRACCNIRVIGQGMLIHDHIIRGGLLSDMIIGNALLDMYCKCGVLEEAQKVFDTLQKRDVVSWGAIMAGYVQHGHGVHALELFKRMQQEDIKPNLILFSSALKACGNTGGLEQGKLLHDWIIRTGLHSDIVIENTLIDMYAKCGSVEEAKKVFGGLLNRDVVSWGAMIAGYAVHGPSHCAFELFHDMQQDGVQPCKATFLSILKACVSGVAVERGRAIHDQIIRSGLEGDSVIGNTLVDMYGKCGSLEEACRVFDHLQDRDVVSWGALIAGYAAHGHCHIAVQLFQEMQYRGMVVSNSILSCILKVCGYTKDARQGRLVHAQITELEFQSDLIGNALMEMYARCRSFEDAQEVFEMHDRNVDSWASFITSCSQHCHSDCAFKLYDMMQQQDIEPNNVIYSCILKVCSSIGNIRKGRLIHDHIIRTELELDIIIGNTLVGMYAKSGSIEEACKVFSALPDRDIVSWGAIITGYVEHGHDVAALESFQKLQLEGMKPNEATLLSSLKACGSIGAFEQGKLIHDHIIRSGFQLDVVIGSTLLDMYAKCGRLQEAQTVFDGLPHQDIVAWGALVAGCALNGRGKLAMQSFKDMQMQGLRPDEVIFTNVLAACSHSGFVEEGYLYFKSLKEDYSMKPNMEQYSCMIDLLGRSGHLIEAEDMLQTIPVPPDIVDWLSLLTSCRTYGNTEQGRRCYEEVTQLDSVDASSHMLMSSIYADAHMWKDVEHIQKLRTHVCVQKKAGRAWIEVNNKVQEFSVGEGCHSQSSDIFCKLRRLYKSSKDVGLTMQLGLVWELCPDEVQRV